MKSTSGARGAVVGRLDRVAGSAWFAYGSILLIQAKVLWGIWEHRDLTAGTDATNYFIQATDDPDDPTRFIVQQLVNQLPAGSIKNTLNGGDIPVAWINTKYRMVYVNYGHGDQIYSGPPLPTMIDNILRWLLSR